MTIWIIAVLLLASLAGLGLRQGAIRVGFSLIGILLGGLLAGPIGHLLKPVFSAVGVKNPVMLWLLPPVVVFVIVLTLAKVAGLFVHKKVEVFYKYKAGDLRLALWERLNQRLGLCLGSLNAIAYTVLIAQAIYMVSYWTVQASTTNDPRSVRIMNRLGKDLQSTGLSKVAHSVDHTSTAYYDAADIAGLLYQTPPLEARLSRYPAILGLAERQEFQDLANDTEFSQMRERGASIAEIINYPKVQAILNNPELLKTVESSIEPNLKDLRAFLETGISEKFPEEILGRWLFDVNGAIGLLRREKPNTSSREMALWKNWLVAAASKAVMIATPEHQIFLKNIPIVNTGNGAPAPKVASVQGEWQGESGKYTLTVSIDGNSQKFNAEIHGSRLAVTAGDFMGLAFNREE
ncbi:MAG TPA: hypothetical protein VFW05_16245 [Verrucomicrobiae bacterium]|nr:hypothetical protein [Verrucomicrobiae bacterium]